MVEGWTGAPADSVRVFAWNHETGEFEQLAATTSNTQGILLYDALTLYAVSTPVQLRDAHWLPGARGHSARLRARSDTVGWLSSVSEGWFECYQSDPDPNSFAERCTSPNSPDINVYTEDWVPIVDATALELSSQERAYEVHFIPQGEEYQNAVRAEWRGIIALPQLAATSEIEEIIVDYADDPWTMTFISHEAGGLSKVVTDHQGQRLGLMTLYWDDSHVLSLDLDGDWLVDIQQTLFPNGELLTLTHGDQATEFMRAVAAAAEAFCSTPQFTHTGLPSFAAGVPPEASVYPCELAALFGSPGTAMRAGDAINTDDIDPYWAAARPSDHWALVCSPGALADGDDLPMTQAFMQGIEHTIKYGYDGSPDSSAVQTARAVAAVPLIIAAKPLIYLETQIPTAEQLSKINEGWDRFARADERFREKLSENQSDRVEFDWSGDETGTEGTDGSGSGGSTGGGEDTPDPDPDDGGGGYCGGDGGQCGGNDALDGGNCDTINNPTVDPTDPTGPGWGPTICCGKSGAAWYKAPPLTETCSNPAENPTAEAGSSAPASSVLPIFCGYDGRYRVALGGDRLPAVCDDTIIVGTTPNDPCLHDFIGFAGTTHSIFRAPDFLTVIEACNPITGGPLCQPDLGL